MVFSHYPLFSLFFLEIVHLGEKYAKMGLLCQIEMFDNFLKSDGPLNISVCFFFHKVPSKSRFLNLHLFFPPKNCQIYTFFLTDNYSNIIWKLQMDRILNMNGTIWSKIVEYQKIRIIRCNSALASINIQNSQKIH